MLTTKGKQQLKAVNCINLGTEKTTIMKASILLLGLMICTIQFSSATNEIFKSDHYEIDLIQLDDENEIKTKWDNALGTFQFEILKKRSSRAMIQIRMEVIDEILESRHETEIVYIPYKYNDEVRIKILPHSEINGEFEKLELRTVVDSFE